MAFTQCRTPMASTKTIGASRGYEKVRDIGQGGFGLAALVQDKHGASRVMKLIDISRMPHQQQRDAVDEAKILASLKHPYIVRFREGFIEDGKLAIVMDFADRGDLHERITQAFKMQQPFQERQIVKWITQATLGLSYLHERQIIHRDLKSQNMFLNGERLQIGDFGISKVLQRQNARGVIEKQIIGTPHCFSPEIILLGHYSFDSDVWALGCVLFEVIALRVPFDGTSLPAIVSRITEGTIPSFPRSCSSQLQQLCRDLLNQDPRHRPSCAEIAQRSIIKVEMANMLQQEHVATPSTPSKYSDTMSRMSSSSKRSSSSSGFSTQTSGSVCSSKGMLMRSGSAALLHRQQPTTENPLNFQCNFRSSSQASTTASRASSNTSSRAASSCASDGRPHSRSRMNSPRARDSPFLRQQDRASDGGDNRWVPHPSKVNKIKA